MKLPANTLLQLFLIWAVSLLSWPQWLCSHFCRETQVSLGPTKWGIQVNEDSQIISPKLRGSFKEKLPTRRKCVGTWVSPICGDEKKSLQIHLLLRTMSYIEYSSQNCTAQIWAKLLLQLLWQQSRGHEYSEHSETSTVLMISKATTREQPRNQITSQI